MPEIDPVILQLRAEVQQYRNDIRSVTVLVESQLGRQEAAVQRLESQIRASSDQIGGAFRGIAGALAGAFSAREVATLIDSYTRFTNQLKVAGLEGESLAIVQERLFGIAQRYGVELEAVGTLYGRSAASAKELGLSQKEQATITEATAAALKVSGASATEASGALLQLSQALGGNKIQAEEYNSLIDSLRPLLGAVAAGSEKWGGSVAKLTADVKNGNVTTREFVNALLKGAPSVIKQAENATLTLSGAFTKLTNSLTVYVGQSAQANGATNVIANALDLLAKNLDTVADALAVIGTILVGRFAAGMVAAAGSTGLVSAALFALQARAAGAATTMEALAFAGGTAGRTLLAAFGGPVGLAVTALAAGVYILATNTSDASREAQLAEKVNARLGDTSKNTAEAIDRLATAHGRAREEARKAVIAERDLIKEKIRSAQASLLLAGAELSRAQSQARLADQRMKVAGGDPRLIPATGAVQVKDNLAAASNEYEAQQRVVGSLMQQLGKLDAALKAPETKLSPIDDGKKKKVKKDSFSDVDQYDRELAQQKQEQLRAEEQLATDGNQQAKIRHQQVEADVAAYAKSLEDRLNSESLTKAQKARIIEQNKALLAQREATAQLEHSLINRELDDRLTSEEVDLQRSRLDAQRESLDNALDMARTEKDRRAVQLQILDAEMEARRIALQQVLDSRNSTDAQKQVATEELGRLPGQRASRARSIERQTQGPLEAYLDKIPKITAEIDERVQGYVVDELDAVKKGISDAITSKLGVKDPLLAGLLDLFIEQVLIKPIGEALAGASGSGGSISQVLGAIIPGIGSLFGRASGGYVAPGQTVRVNESRGGMELLRMGSQGGTVIPLGRTDAARPQAGTTVVSAPQFNMKGAVVTRELFAEMQRISQQSAAQASIAMGKQVMKAVPGRLAQFQNDGT